jgi:phosphatidylserine decarboxylase
MKRNQHLVSSSVPLISRAIDRAAAPAMAVSAVPAAVAAFSGHRRTAAALASIPLGVAAFFRDPDRTPDHRQVDPDLVVAPADGRVMYAGPGQVGVAPAGQWQQVSIFLSLFDVHINRTPYSGRVEEVTYRPGKWHAAYRFESATENERSEITLSETVGGEERRVVCRQIVGLVARRVVTRVQPGDVLRTGQRIGLMKFGSRMDVFVPPHVELVTAKGDRTVAGETVIARWPQSVGPVRAP